MHLKKCFVDYREKKGKIKTFFIRKKMLGKRNNLQR